jgi:hypothetical protein
MPTETNTVERILQITSEHGNDCSGGISGTTHRTHRKYFRLLAVMARKQSIPMKMRFWLVLGLAATRLTSWAAPTQPTADVRLNQIQVIGSHNSYHLRAHASLRTILASKDPSGAQTLDYTHPPLPDQLSRLGIRQIELDCFADPKGGLYAHPKGVQWAAKAGLPPVPTQDPEGKLEKPGIKVMHVPDIDYMTTVLTLKDGLRQVVNWSDQHPQHVPVFILIELKEDSDGPDLTQPIPFGEKELAELEQEIAAVVPRQKMIEPDDVRRGERSLPEALRKHGWPTLDSVRGKVLFGLDNESSVRDLYLRGHAALEGRLLFVSVPRDNPAAAWMKMNDPVQDCAQIQALVREGFLVRTRADAETRQARLNDPTQRDKALASGAQYISTDYREPNLAFSTYAVQFDNAIVARSNPINGVPSLAGIDLENPPKATP